MLSSCCAGVQTGIPAPLCLPHCVQTRLQGQDSTPSNADIEEAVKLMEPYFRSANFPIVSDLPAPASLSNMETKLFYTLPAIGIITMAILWSVTTSRSA